MVKKKEDVGVFDVPGFDLKKQAMQIVIYGFLRTLFIFTAGLGQKILGYFICLYIAERLGINLVSILIYISIVIWATLPDLLYILYKLERGGWSK